MEGRGVRKDRMKKSKYVYNRPSDHERKKS